MNPAIPRTLSALLLALLTVACATSPAVHYFNLMPLEPPDRIPAAEAPVLAVGPVILPDYLKRPQLVSRDGIRVHVDDFHRWAEPLDAALPRVLAMNLSAAAPGLVVVAAPFPPSAQYRLAAQVLRFEADGTGEVELLVQWSVTTADGGTLLPPRMGRYVESATPAAEPAAWAAAMSEALSRFGRDVAAALMGQLG